MQQAHANKAFYHRQLGRVHNEYSHLLALLLEMPQAMFCTVICARPSACTHVHGTSASSVCAMKAGIQGKVGTVKVLATEWWSLG